MLRMQDFALNISKFAWGGMPPNPPRKLCSLCRPHPENLFFPISLSLGKNNSSWPDHAVRAASKFNRKKRRKRRNWYLFHTYTWPLTWIDVYMTNMSWKMFLHLHFYINIDIMYCGILLLFVSFRSVCILLLKCRVKSNILWTGYSS